MKQQFNGTYTFTPSTRLVSLSGIDLPLERLYLIVNTTRNVPIFNFAVSGLGATRTSSSGNTIFDLAFDTSSHSSSDKLTIIYDDGFKEPGVQIGDLLGTVTAIDQDGSSFITLSEFSGWVAMAKLNNNGDNARAVQVEISSSSAFGLSNTTALPILFKGNTYTSFNNSQIPSHSPDYGFFHLNPSSLRYLRVKGIAGGGTTTCAFYKANLDQAPRGTPLTDEQLRATAVPVQVGNFPSNQVVSLTNASGTTPATIRENGSSQNADTALVVALHPASAAMVGQGDSFVGASNPLQVSLANTGSNATAVNVAQATAANLKTQAELTRGGNTLSNNNPIPVTLYADGNNFQPRILTPASSIIPTSDGCLLVKSVNMVRLSGDTFIEERRPDVCQAAEWNDLANNGTATIYTRAVPFRRMRVNQIIFSWMYVGSGTVNLFGQFVFQYFNESGTFAGDILKVRLQSGQMHTLTFPNGILSPVTGGSVRVVNQSGGGNINTNFNISLWEE
jgi:hypothetical protein